MTGSPYPGLAPFTESDRDAARFFGRDDAVRLIAANLLTARFTVLYGPAGAGKSSVLRAGVVHRLRSQVVGAVPVAVAYVDAWAEDPSAAVLAAIAAEAQRLHPHGLPGAPADDVPLDEALAAWSAALDARLLLILDQFEEYCLYHALDARPFDRELPRAIDLRDAPVRVLIGLREDALAALDRYKGRIPDLFANRLRLGNLSREAALAAVCGPAEPPLTLEPGLAEAVLEAIAPGQVALASQGRGTAANRDAGVEPALLQLVMDTLWRRETAAGSTVLRLDTLREIGGATAVLRDHVDSMVGRLAPGEQATAAAALHFLVTPSGSKIAHTPHDLAAYADVDEARLASILDRLCAGDTRLLRRVAPMAEGSEPRYEIFHDVLAPAVLDWRARLLARRLQLRTAALLAISAALLAAVLGVIAYTVDPGLVRSAEERTASARASVRGKPAVPRDLVVVDLDAQSLRALGTGWPPPRTVHARLIRALLRDGVRLIGYDVDFESARGTADRALQAAIAGARGRVVLAAAGFGDAGELTLFGNTAPGATAALLKRLGAIAGYSGFPLDARGVYRGVEATVEFPGGPRVRTFPYVVGRLTGARAGPWRGSLPIEFRGGPGTFPTISAGDVLNGRVGPQRLRGKVAIVGSSAPGAADDHPTPAARRPMPGDEIQANAIATVRDVRPRDTLLDVALIVALALVPPALLRVRPVVAGAIIAAVAVAEVVLAQLLFDAGRVVPVAVPLATLALSAVGLVGARRWLATRAGVARTRRRPAASETPQPPASTAPAASSPSLTA
jgi:CHASE2 domain-containing sensor protein